MSQKYDEYLEKHRQAVKKAYQWIAAYIPELTDVEATRNIEFHDMSKNTPDEYTPYDNYFYGEQTPAIIEAFNRAWLIHIHRNPHHWQYWVLINDEPKEGTILIEMPYPYIIEMICDWWAFSWIKFRCNINRILFLSIKNCFCFHSSSVCGNLYCWVLRDSHCTGLWTLQDHGTCKIYNIGQNRLPFLHSSAKPPYKIHRMHFTVKAMTMLETQRQTTSAIACPIL